MLEKLKVKNFKQLFTDLKKYIQKKLVCPCISCSERPFITAKRVRSIGFSFKSSSAHSSTPWHEVENFTVLFYRTFRFIYWFWEV